MPDSLNLQFGPAPRTDLLAIVRMLADDELGARRECFETPLSQAQVASVRLLERLRGQGIGARMMEWSIERASQHGCHLMHLTSHKSRTDADRFYEKLGFTKSHIGMKINI